MGFSKDLHKGNQATTNIAMQRVLTTCCGDAIKLDEHKFIYIFFNFCFFHASLYMGLLRPA